MSQMIKCKYCGKDMEISEGFLHKISEEAILKEKELHKEELEKVREEAVKDTISKLNDQAKREIKTLKEGYQDEKERNLRLIKELESLTDDLREIKRKQQEGELELKRKLVKEQEKIRQDVLREFNLEHDLKDRERDKRLTDALKVNEQLKRKLEQGSQQTQGEVLELDLEENLKNAFPNDRITEIKKGEKGADVMQAVIDRLGRECGRILWETKNAKWSDSWLKKLKDDQRQAKADLAVLVASEPPSGVEPFSYRDNIWVVKREFARALAGALRFDLIHIHQEKLANVGKNEKTEILYKYLRSPDFRLRIEAIIEAFTGLQEEIEKEKRYFNTKWARQEKELRKMIDNTHGMYGEFQAIVGRDLKSITGPPDNGDKSAD